MPSPEQLFFALAGGILPALLWLWFWLHEDRLHPEPRGRIVSAFLAGMGAAVLAYPLERFVLSWKPTLLIIFISWAVIEELVKFSAAYFSALRSKDDDEPIDPVMYLITAALGFAALENTLYLLGIGMEGDVFRSVVMGNFRFVGATLLHVLSAGIAGIALGFSFYKPKMVRVLAGAGGLCTAIILHTLFNVIIIGSKPSSTFIVFLFVWLALTLLLAAFEKLKQLERKHSCNL